MSTPESELIGEFELHDVDAIRKLLKGGLDPAKPIRGKSAVNRLLEMYTRSDRFPDCLRVLLDHGAVLDNPLIEPVLLNEKDALTRNLRNNPDLIHHRTSLISAFTPLVGATLLHIAAEYGNLDAARILIEHGADVNAAAATDSHGLNGHTPIFHTVNSNDNRSAPIMRMLLDAGADPQFRVAGITWGRGFDWETTLFDLTPISYAQCGLLPQF